MGILSYYQQQETAMPYITIDTNSDKAAAKEMLTEAVNLVAGILNKPKEFVIVKINNNKIMSAGEDPAKICALIEVKSIGYGGKIQDLARELTNFAIRHFGAEGKLVGMHFADMPATNVAHDGRTMA